MKRSRLKKGKAHTKKHRMTLGEALGKLRHRKIYADYSAVWMPEKTMKRGMKQITEQVKLMSPKAKVTLLPQVKHVPFRDFRVSNVTAGEALQIAVTLSGIGIILKG